MKAALPSQEPQWLNWWQKIHLYEKRCTSRNHKPLFILHDGPPYANGPIHAGHALNKILKDFCNRFQYNAGKKVYFIPGWDCHGLPIENQIEKNYAAKNMARADISVSAFRQECRDFAQQWIDNQKKDFERLGVNADWKNHYATMDPLFTAKIVRHFFTLFQKGYVYRGLRPVLWSPWEQTALAEAETEYHDMVSPSLYIKFPLVNGKGALSEASVVIWTTTPWSLPANRAVAYGSELIYGVYRVASVTVDSLVTVGEKLVMGKKLYPQLCAKLGIISAECIHSFSGEEFKGMHAEHPLYREGYAFTVPLIPSEYVSEDAGTGLVHTAPSHGVEDFIVGQRHGLEVTQTLNHSGHFMKEIPLVGDLFMDKAYPVIKNALMNQRNLLAVEQYKHSYPHSWRSKKPLFYRATPQWFIALDEPHHLRTESLQAISTVSWFPASGEQRIAATMKARPDWCISRQRLWGVPIAMFLHEKTGEILNDVRVFDRIEAKIAAEGVDFWFTDAAYSVLEGLYDTTEWKKNTDIIDVWFESGVTHAVVLKDMAARWCESKEEQSAMWPATVYLEGSDQHRAWFQSSLATSMAEIGKPPYKAVITHGFLLDEKGQKMSKSLGNVVSPQDVIEEKGADILRLWVAYEDYQKDLRMGKTILQRVEDMYRKIRNTYRFLLGGLQGFSLERTPQTLPEGFLHQWIHHQLWSLWQDMQKDVETYNFRALLHRLHLFCTVDLSSFYFDVHKDALYCDNRDNVQHVFFHLVCFLTHAFSAILPFTTEEVWHVLARDVLGFDPESQVPDKIIALLKAHGMEGGHEGIWSIHLRAPYTVPESWCNHAIAAEMTLWRTIRSVVMAALEKSRAQKIIASNAQAEVTIVLHPDTYAMITQNYCWATFCIISKATVIADPTPAEVKGDDMETFYDATENICVIVRASTQEKCIRCWRYIADVDPENGMCKRCEMHEATFSEE